VTKGIGALKTTPIRGTRPELAKEWQKNGKRMAKEWQMNTPKNNQANNNPNNNRNQKRKKDTFQ